MDNQELTKTGVLRFIEDNDIKFIRLTFCDLFGMQKNISIMAGELERAFTYGIGFDAAAITGFDSVETSDLILKPDPTTITLLPWRPQQGRVARFYCSILHPDGTPYEFDSREILKRAVRRCADAGYSCKVGAECEFYLFKTDENGYPTTEPFDNGGYFDMTPLDQGENVRREICLTLEEMGLYPESSHHEQGPGQNEIDFRFSDALVSADEFMTFRSAVKAIAARNGLFASFLPKPLPGKSGSGMHINVSLHKDGENLFHKGSSRHDISGRFIAGVLDKAAEMSPFLNPLQNSYERLGAFEAPSFVAWSNCNRSQLIRIPAAAGERSRMELRSPDPSANPYLAYALVLSAGLQGIERGLDLPEPADFDAYAAGAQHGLSKLPLSLGEALDAAEKSAFLKETLGADFVKRYLTLKRGELERGLDAAAYFPVI